ncbi:MAG: type IV pilus modification protein PilV [Methylobacter sp.]|jgi:type IV pilus assembly protein PilV|nr:type IV pilus modification protein PilV [Methylobacter sp.]
MPKINFRRTRGFTLIEVLVSMIILALGLLGLASLQGIALKNNQDAYLFGQANALAYEMSDRIKANRQGWTTGTIPTAAASCATGCDGSSASCTTAQMAAFDYCYWKQNATTKLAPNATAVITASPKTGSTTCTGAAPSLCLTMTWSRTNQNLSASMNTTNFELEVTP